MNKAQLTDAVAAATDTSKAEAGRAVEATLNAIAGSLAGGDSVLLVGFGIAALFFLGPDLFG